MSNLLAIDPGRCTGFAFFRDGALSRAGVTSIDARACPATNILTEIGWCSGDLFVIEVPQVYRPGQSKGDPNDLIKLAIEVGRWIERATVCGARYAMHRPNEWKGQIPKEIHHGRAEAALYPSERALLPSLPRDTRHNMMDAVALGLWKLGRIR